MKKLTFSVLLLALIGYANCVTSFYADYEIQTLKNIFQPVVEGKNAIVTADLIVNINKQKFQIKYKFWTRRHTHDQWATSLQIISPDDVRPFFFKSVYTNNQLYRKNSMQNDSNYMVNGDSILENFLISGLVIDGDILERHTMNSANQRQVNGQFIKYYDLQLLSIDTTVGITCLVGDFPQIYDILYRPGLQSDYIYAYNIHVTTDENMSDKIFEVSSIADSNFINSELFMGLYGIVRNK